jgi:hypothetical protein
MRRFSAWARWIATAILIGVGAIFTDVVFPVVTRLIQEQPQETANVFWVVLKFLRDLSEQTWLRAAALSLGCFVAGLWVDWLLRRLDGSRTDERKALGTEMVELGNVLRSYSGKPRGLYMPAARPRIESCFTTARKLGIWVPDDRIFSIIHFPHAMDLITDYLWDVGTMLQGGHFSEAKQHAKSRKAAFDKAYAN